jgi:UDP-4-amino-4,6-dideoxy-N-acetyl-beta-L-altrosamine N-acetyltransferase
MLEWHHAPHVQAACFSEYQASLEQFQKWFESIAADKRIRYLVFERNQIALGIVNFVDIDRRHSRAQWGLYLGEANQPKATGTVLGYCGLDYGFKILGLRRITAEVMESNPKAISLHKRLGFVQEGCFRAHVLKNGRYHDVLTLALVADDWRTVYRPRLGEALFSDWTDNMSVNQNNQRHLVTP